MKIPHNFPSAFRKNKTNSPPPNPSLQKKKKKFWSLKSHQKGDFRWLTLSHIPVIHNAYMSPKFQMQLKHKLIISCLAFSKANKMSSYVRNEIILRPSVTLFTASQRTESYNCSSHPRIHFRPVSNLMFSFSVSRSPSSQSLGFAKISDVWRQPWPTSCIYVFIVAVYRINWQLFQLM